MEWVTLLTDFFATPAGIATIILGSMTDAVIGLGFIVHGEIFFVAAGYLAATETLYWVLPMVYVAAWCGDLVSYAIGLHGGRRLVLKVAGKNCKRRKAYRKVKGLIHRYGYPGITLSRLLGPVSWVVPFAAGSMKLAPGRFALFSAMGVCLGVSQFILIGYLLGYGVDLQWPSLAWEFMPLLVFIVIAISGSLIIYKVAKRLKSRLITRIVTHGTCWCITFVLMNCWMFFYGTTHAERTSVPIVADMFIREEFKVYPGTSGKGYHAQPFNVILVTDLSLRGVHEKVGWVENMVFSRNRISIGRYLQSVFENTPPVTDLYLAQTPQLTAYQDPGGNLMYRHHIRWWQLAGKSGTERIYAGSISTDDEIQPKLYNGIVALIHDINPNVDAARDMFVKIVKAAHPHASVEYIQTDWQITPETSGDYYTDGRVALIRVTSVPVSSPTACSDTPEIKLSSLEPEIMDRHLWGTGLQLGRQ